MPRFTYTARDRSGQTVSDAVEAPSRRDALRLLAARGLHVISASDASPAPVNGRGRSANGAATPSPRLERRRNVARAQRLPFLESLHDLTTSGMSAGEAVRLLSTRIKEPALRALCSALWERLSEGAPLSRAMSDFPAVFDAATVNLIQAGEATGSLNETLDRLITHLNEQRELRRQLVAALAYPIFMVVVATGVILFFLFFLLPRLQVLLTSLGGELPMSTKLLVGLAQFALHYGLFVALGLVLGAIAFWRWRHTEPGRQATDAWLLKLPVVGPFVVSQTVLAFSQTLGVLLANGITAAEALRMTERQIANRVHRRAFDEATARVLEGEALSLALGRTGCFPDLVLDRLAVGENTGNVVPSLRDIARSYQKIVSNQLNLFTKVIASGVLLLVFVLVGFIAFAIVSAVFKVSGSFKLG
ncbi:type II secretion system F family protein [Opitutus terrae]|uniref:Type II secretion system protein n=1 Tax=Opitutus terrae (strain DSM 11246 / JCM 15787 / PB90-1) TaxID=452637 RepID=B1ZUL9_OPITP|nr:type II secretion system F family protein [Opitutus terrae]ACB74903.1 type II secretion system protein [Opitutus terrae PB90-1]